MSKKPEKNNGAAPALPPCYAAVDIGSNKIRLAFYAVDAEGNFVGVKVPEQTKFVCALAEGMTDDNAVIKTESLAAAKEALKYFANLIKDYKISSNNISAVATAALRAVEKGGENALPEQIAALREAFAPYKFKIISEKTEAVLVAEAALCDPQFAKTAFLLAQDNMETKVAAIGGGSTEVCVITKEGRLKNPVAINQGVLTLKEIERTQGKQAVTEVFPHALQQTIAPSESCILYATGGAWRALGKTLCERKNQSLSGKKDILTKLAAAAKLSVAHYKTYRDSIAERADSMPLAAAVLRMIAAHTGAEHLIFLNNKMVDALARRLHRQALSRSVQFSSRQLSSPSAPAQALRA